MISEISSGLVVALLDFQGYVDFGRSRRTSGIRGRRFEDENVSERLVQLLLQGDDAGGVVPLEVLDVGRNARGGL